MQNEKEPSRRKKTNGHPQPEGTIDMLNVQADEMRERLASVDTQLRKAARQRPIAVIGGALLVGYLVGRVFSR